MDNTLRQLDYSMYIYDFRFFAVKRLIIRGRFDAGDIVYFKQINFTGYLAYRASGVLNVRLYN